MFTWDSEYTVRASTNIICNRDFWILYNKYSKPIYAIANKNQTNISKAFYISILNSITKRLGVWDLRGSHPYHGESNTSVPGL